MEPTPINEQVCPTCHGMRFVVPAGLQPGDPGFGRAIPCPTGCNRSLAQQRLRQLDGLSGDQRLLDFRPNWNPKLRPAADGLRAALRRQPAGFVLLAGPYGCGKTHLLCATVNAAITAGWSAVYMTTADLLQHFRQAYAPDARVNYDGLYQRVVDATVLCLDEIDRINATDWAQEQLFKLLDARYEAAVYGGADGQRRLTVCATNAKTTDLEPYLASRFLDRASSIYEFWGAPDMRSLREIAL